MTICRTDYIVMGIGMAGDRLGQPLFLAVHNDPGANMYWSQNIHDARLFETEGELMETITAAQPMQMIEQAMDVKIATMETVITPTAAAFPALAKLEQDIADVNARITESMSELIEAQAATDVPKQTYLVNRIQRNTNKLTTLTLQLKLFNHLQKCS